MKAKIAKGLFEFAKSPVGRAIAGYVFGYATKFLTTKKVTETDKVIAFWHPKPTHDKHVLIIPKKRIKNLTALSDKDSEYIEEAFKVIREIIQKERFVNYSVVVNGGSKQKIPQLHFHLIEDMVKS